VSLCSGKPSPPWRGEVNDSYVEMTGVGLSMKDSGHAIVDVESNDKDYRTMNEVRRNRRFIVAMAIGK
jgi:hypothetical protein